MTPLDLKETLSLARRLFPRADKHWSEAEWELFAEKVSRYGVNAEQAAAVLKEHRAETTKAVPQIPIVRQMLANACRSPRPVTAAPAAAPVGVPISGYMRELWVRWKANPEEPVFKRLAAKGSLPWLLSEGRAAGVIA